MYFCNYDLPCENSQKLHIRGPANWCNAQLHIHKDRIVARYTNQSGTRMSQAADQNKTRELSLANLEIAYYLSPSLIQSASNSECWINRKSILILSINETS